MRVCPPPGRVPSPNPAIPPGKASGCQGSARRISQRRRRQHENAVGLAFSSLPFCSAQAWRPVGLFALLSLLPASQRNRQRNRCMCSDSVADRGSCQSGESTEGSRWDTAYKLEPVSNDFALTTEATERLLLSDTTSIWCKVI